VVEPAHVWVQLAAMLPHDDLVAVGDRWVTPQGRGLSARAALTSIDALRAAIPARSRSAARARRALADVRVGPESRMETLLRLLLVRSGLPEPEVNPAYEIDGETFHPDLAYPQWAVVLEYEGDVHRTDQRVWRSDIARREAFESAGQRVIRVQALDVLAKPEAFLSRVARIIAQRQAAGLPGTLVRASESGGRLSE
jgi:very-short-patch-repair endonuclease